MESVLEHLKSEREKVEKTLRIKIKHMRRQERNLEKLYERIEDINSAIYKFITTESVQKSNTIQPKKRVHFSKPLTHTSQN